MDVLREKTPGSMKKNKTLRTLLTWGCWSSEALVYLWRKQPTSETQTLLHTILICFINASQSKSPSCRDSCSNPTSSLVSGKLYFKPLEEATNFCFRPTWIISDESWKIAALIQKVQRCMKRWPWNWDQAHLISLYQVAEKMSKEIITKGIIWYYVKISLVCAIHLEDLKSKNDPLEMLNESHSPLLVWDISPKS